MISEFKNCIVADSSGKRVKIAHIENGKIVRCIESDSAALESFSKTLSESCPDILKVEAFCICTGPGSVLGARTASVAVSTIAKLSDAKIFEWDSMELSAKAIKDRGECNFIISAPSRKGFANILEGNGSGISEEKEISLEEIANAKMLKIYLLDQRVKVAPELDSFEKLDLSAEEIAKTISAHPELLHPCSVPPDAKSPAKKEYVKWKAQAHI